MRAINFFHAKDIAKTKIPAHFMGVVDERTSGFVAACMRDHSTDINAGIREAIRSAYLQGVTDGAQLPRREVGS